MFLAARWRKARRSGPELIAVTVDHGLRPGSVREARDVKRLAASLGVVHVTKRWTGAKPATGLPAAARAARYALLAEAARKFKATHIVTAHTRDDQAETVLMRLVRGSGIAGLAAMSRQSERDGLILARPFLDVPKTRLIATLAGAKIPFAADPTNHDVTFTRPRLRAMMPALAAEGCDSRNLARLAARLARADVALDHAADEAAGLLGIEDGRAPPAGLDVSAFDRLPDEIRLRLLLRLIEKAGHEGRAELAKVEALLRTMDRSTGKGAGQRLTRTLAGALVSRSGGRLRIEAAPPRRRRRE